MTQGVVTDAPLGSRSALSAPRGYEHDVAAPRFLFIYAASIRYFNAANCPPGTVDVEPLLFLSHSAASLPRDFMASHDRRVSANPATRAF